MRCGKVFPRSKSEDASSTSIRDRYVTRLGSKLPEKLIVSSKIQPGTVLVKNCMVVSSVKCKTLGKQIIMYKISAVVLNLNEVEIRPYGVDGDLQPGVLERNASGENVLTFTKSGSYDKSSKVVEMTECGVTRSISTGSLLTFTTFYPRDLRCLEEGAMVSVNNLYMSYDPNQIPVYMFSFSGDVQMSGVLNTMDFDNMLQMFVKNPSFRVDKSYAGTMFVERPDESDVMDAEGNNKPKMKLDEKMIVTYVCTQSLLESFPAMSESHALFLCENYSSDDRKPEDILTNPNRTFFKRVGTEENGWKWVKNLNGTYNQLIRNGDADCNCDDFGYNYTMSLSLWMKTPQHDWVPYEFPYRPNFFLTHFEWPFIVMGRLNETQMAEYAVNKIENEPIDETEGGHLVLSVNKIKFGFELGVKSNAVEVPLEFIKTHMIPDESDVKQTQVGGVQPIFRCNAKKTRWARNVYYLNNAVDPATWSDPDQRDEYCERLFGWTGVDVEYYMAVCDFETIKLPRGEESELDRFFKKLDKAVESGSEEYIESDREKMHFWAIVTHPNRKRKAVPIPESAPDVGVVTNTNKSAKIAVLDTPHTTNCADNQPIEDGDRYGSCDTFAECEDLVCDDHDGSDDRDDRDDRDECPDDREDHPAGEHVDENDTVSKRRSRKRKAKQ